MHGENKILPKDDIELGRVCLICLCIKRHTVDYHVKVVLLLDKFRTLLFLIYGLKSDRGQFKDIVQESLLGTALAHNIEPDQCVWVMQNFLYCCGCVCCMCYLLT